MRGDHAPREIGRCGPRGASFQTHALKPGRSVLVESCDARFRRHEFGACPICGHLDQFDDGLFKPDRRSKMVAGLPTRASAPTRRWKGALPVRLESPPTRRERPDGSPQRKLIRYPPDDGGLDAHVGSTCPFCQCWVPTAIHKAHCVSHHARWHVGSCRAGCDQDASLPRVGLERMTIERFTRAPHRAAVAVPR